MHHNQKSKPKVGHQNIAQMNVNFTSSIDLSTLIKYYPYEGDKPDKKYYIITNNNKKSIFSCCRNE
jgi:hypothetical protein